MGTSFAQVPATKRVIYRGTCLFSPVHIDYTAPERTGRKVNDLVFCLCLQVENKEKVDYRQFEELLLVTSLGKLL